MKHTHFIPKKQEYEPNKMPSKSVMTIEHKPKFTSYKEVEKGKISVSFNLDFTKLLTTTQPSKRPTSRKLIQSHRDVENPCTYLLPKRDSFSRKRSVISPSQRDPSESKEGSVTERSKYSYETPTKKNIKGHFKQNSNTKLKSLLDKIKQCKPAINVKEKNCAKMKTSIKRGSEGDISLTTRRMHQSQVSTSIQLEKSNKGEIFGRKRDQFSSTVRGSNFHSFEQQPKSQSGLLRIKNKLVVSVLKC